MGGKTIKGFTLMELMVVLAVAALILAFAVPTFREFRLNARMTAAANDLLAGLQLARSEAIKRQKTVALCASANPDAAEPTCGAEFAGWVVWVDEDDDATRDAIEPVIAAHEPLDPSLRVSSDGSFVSFSRTGFTQREVAGTPAATLAVICDERGDASVGDSYRKRLVALSPTGRPAILKTIEEVADAGEAAGMDVSCGPVG